MEHKNENNAEDYWLVAKVLQGDHAAFSKIIRNTQALVSGIIFKMVSDTEDRKDMAQDVYLKAFRNLASFRFQSKLSTWIARIAYNTCLNYLALKRIVVIDHNDFSEDGDEDDLAEASLQIHHITAGPEQQLLNKDLAGILKKEIDRLSPVFRTMITLYHHEGMSYTEIAEITAMPEGTVKSYLFRARKALKESLLNNYKKEAL